MECQIRSAASLCESSDDGDAFMPPESSQSTAAESTVAESATTERATDYSFPGSPRLSTDAKDEVVSTQTDRRDPKLSRESFIEKIRKLKPEEGEAPFNEEQRRKLKKWLDTVSNREFARIQARRNANKP